MLRCRHAYMHTRIHTYVLKTNNSSDATPPLALYPSFSNYLHACMYACTLVSRMRYTHMSACMYVFAYVRARLYIYIYMYHRYKETTRINDTERNGLQQPPHFDEPTFIQSVEGLSQALETNSSSAATDATPAIEFYPPSTHNEA